MKKIFLPLLALVLYFPEMQSQAFAAGRGRDFYTAAAPVSDSETASRNEEETESGEEESEESAVAADPCSPNPCSGETPLCTPLSRGAKASGKYICGCNPANDECMPGRHCGVRCSAFDMTCTNNPTAADIYWACVPCPKGTPCKCETGKVADGAGKCVTDDKCNPNPCSGATPLCQTDLSVPSGYVCGCNSDSCPAGQECTFPHHNVYVCAPCKAGKNCNCPKGFTSDGSGGCKPKPTCDTMICPEDTTCLESDERLCCVPNDVDCGKGCDDCDRTKGICRRCGAGHYLSDGKCASCPAHCADCSDGTFCRSCESGYRQVNGKCEGETSCTGVECPAGQTCQDGVCGILCFPENCSAPYHCNPLTHDCTGGRCGCLKGSESCMKCND